MTEYIGEQWKTIEFNFEYTNEARFEISNYGRIRSFHKTSNGNVLKGSTINGYKIIRLKFFTPREKEVQAQLTYLQEQVQKLSKHLTQMKKNGVSKESITETQAVLETVKESLKKKFAADTKSRTINWHSLIHRLVAEHFLVKPTEAHTIVAHLDHEKNNNKESNLKWMTPEENYQHQQTSPYVIKEKQEKRTGNKSKSKATKLTVTKVMLLKKMLNQGKPMKELVRFFKVTETQIIRIKRGENWKEVEPAP